MNKQNVKAYGTAAPDAALKQMNIDRREVTAKDVEIDILYCGVCHSDLHTARNEWHGTVYPNVPGHEIVGRIRKVGSGVTKQINRYEIFTFIPVTDNISNSQ